MELLQRKKDLLIALSKVGWMHERAAHLMVGGSDKDLAITFKAVNDLAKMGIITTMWKDTDIALVLTERDYVC